MDTVRQAASVLVVVLDSDAREGLAVAHVLVRTVDGESSASQNG